MNIHKIVASDILRMTGRYSQILTSFFILLLIFSTCTKEKETERSYPRVVTGLVTNINAGGATFNGSFLQAGSGEIIDHGFVFDNNISFPTVHSSEKISLGISTGSGSFTATASFGLEKGKTYYVSAYAQNKDKIFYAEPVSFVSMGGTSPEIFAIVPSEGLGGDTVHIKGRYFSQQPLNNRVRFGERDAVMVAASDTIIAVRIPPANGKEHVDVFVTTFGQTAQKINGFQYLKPIISDISPKQGVIGDTITISGKYLRPDMEIKFNQVKAKIYKSDNISAKVIVPACQSTQASISIIIGGLMGIAEQAFIYAQAEITGLSADKGVVGDTIVVQGKNFGHQKDVISVFVGEQTATIVKTNNAFLEVIIPASGGKPTLPISVRVDGQLASSHQMFTYMTPVIESFEPTSGKAGTIVNIKGKYFSVIKGQNSVMVDQINLRILETDKNQMRVIVSDTTYSATSSIAISVDGRKAESVTKFEIISPWTQKNDFPTEYFLGDIVSFSVDGAGYIMANYYYYPEGLHGGSSDFWQYQSDRDAWVKKKDHSTAVRQEGFVGFEINEKYCYSDTWSGWDIYNPINDSWIHKNEWEMHTSHAVYAFAINNTGYQVRQNYDNNYETWMYQPDNDIWILKNVIGPYSNLGFSFSTRTKAYAKFGDELMEYTPETNTWRTKTTIPVEIKNAKVLTIQDKAYFLFSEDTRNNVTKVVWEYTPSDNQWRKISYNPSDSQYNMFSFVIGDKIYTGLGLDRTQWYVKTIWEFDPSKL